MRVDMSSSPLGRPARVVRILLQRDEDGLALSLLLRSDADLSEVELHFTGVSQVKFRGETTDLGGIVLLQCEDISARGWEGIRFQVADYEDEFVSFYCNEIRQQA